MKPLVLVVYRVLIVCVVAGLFHARSAQCQGSVSGIVVDAPTAKPIEGVSVVLAATLFGTVTGPDGTFTLGPVADGVYTLRVVRSGFEPVELTVSVPADPIVLRLGKERPPLVADPMGTGSAGFSLGIFGARGDPLLSSPDRALDRIPGIAVMRYGTALVQPLVRGFGDGRTSVLDGSYPSTVLDIPGLGRLNLAQDHGFGNGTAYYGLTPSRSAGSQATVWFVPDPFSDGVFARAILEAGYQTNIDAFETRGLFHGHVSGTRYRIEGSRSDASGFEAASGLDVAAGHKRTAGAIDVERALGSRSSLRIGGRVVDVRSMEFPGAYSVLDRGTMGGLSARLQLTSERSWIRRITAEAGIASSDAVLASTTSGDRNGSARKTAIAAGMVADLYHPGLDRFRFGFGMTTDRSEGRVEFGRDTASIATADFWPNVRTTTAIISLTAGKNGLSTNVDVEVRAGVTRQKSYAFDNTNGVNEEDVTDVVGSVSLAILHRRSRSLRFLARASVHRSSPSELQRFSEAAPPVDGPRAVVYVGNQNLVSEQAFVLDLGMQKRFGRTSVEFRPYIAFVNNFVSARPPGVVGAPAATLWTYRNGSAEYLGFEASASYVPIPFASVSGHVDYVLATDRRREEPPILVSPFSGRVDFTAASPGGRILVELSSEFAFGRDRVATQVGELPSKGYVLIHWWVGIPLSDRLSVRLGVFNLFNSQFEPNPGSQNIGDTRRLPGPGRSWLFVGRVTV